MWHISGKTTVFLGITLLASALFLFPASALAGETVTHPGSSLGNPSDIFINNPPSDKPNMPQSLFPLGGSVTGNTVAVGSSLGGNVYGGITPDPGIVVENNKVTITGGTIGSATSSSGTVTGGWSRNGNVTGNKIFINDDGSGGVIAPNNDIRVRGIIYGGWVNEGVGSEAGYNTVTINGSNTQIDDNIYGAYTNGRGKATGNIVTINDGDITRTRSNRGIMAGAYSSSIGGSLTAGEDVTGNKVVIKGGTIDYFDIYGGRGRYHDVSGNTVTITGGTISNSAVYGGQNYQAGRVGDIHNNTVDISGGSFSGDVSVYGGFSNAGNAMHNTVNIGGTASFTGNSAVYGGGRSAGGGGDVFMGNTLNKNNAAAIGTVGNFEFVNFGYGGSAKIGFLDTTPTGSYLPGVKVNTNAGDVIFGGVIGGTGSLTKTGANDLTLTGNANRILSSAGVSVQGGELRIGNGQNQGALFTRLFNVGSGATLAYDRADVVTYGGLIAGTGTLAQTGGAAGTGTLILTGDNNTIGKVTITKGTLQLGDGGATGSITTGADGIAIDSGAALAYRHSNAIVDNNKITGDGKVVQRGAGTLTLTNTGNTFAGGTEIESGALNIVAPSSIGYNVSGSLNTVNHTAASNAGYVTFTGGGNSKNVFIGSGVASLNSSFRTASGAGSSNTVTIAPSPALSIDGNKNSHEGGVFYVAPGTAMNVHNNSLLWLAENKATGGSGEYSNDLYVADGGTFNLYTNDYTRFESGIDSGGAGSTLNLFTSANAVLNPRIDFINTGASANPPIFSMGKTTITGAVDKGMTLVVGRMNPASMKRTEFKNDTSFTIQGLAGGVSLTAAALAGDGIIQAGTLDTALGDGVDTTLAGNGGVISVRNGAVLIPTALQYSPPPNNEMSITYGTLTLNAETVRLTDFGYIYQPGANPVTDPGKTQIALVDDTQGVPDSNHSLVNIVSNGKAVMSNGQVAIVTKHGSDSFTQGDYLLMRSNNGFVTPDGRDITSVNIGSVLSVTVDGFAIKPANDNLRGSYGLTMGGDPLSTGAKPATGDPDDNNNNVWLGQSLNSLSMAWTGGAAGNQTSPQSGNWANAFGFFSLQEDPGTHQHETGFMPGDKVYISGTDSVTIDLTRVVPQGASKAANVSGLVVGKNMATGDTAGNGIYTVSDNGGGYGIAAYNDIAIGKYVNLPPNDPDRLAQTGKLEKYGNSTLRFANSGANTFTQGIDLYGGTTQFFRADQLGDDSFNPDGTLNASAKGTQFLGAATLEALHNVRLTNSVTIAAGVTGAFGAAAGTTFNYTGALTGGGTAIFAKTGAGTVRLSAATASPFTGKVDARAGTLDVAANYGATTGFTVWNSATLSGIGTLGGGGGILAGGLLKPGGLVWTGSGTPQENPLNLTNGDVDFAEGGGFAVRLAEYYGNGDKRFSDLVEVSGSGSSVSIDPAATLAVDVDYFKLDLTDTEYYTIIDNTQAAATQTGKFAFNANYYLPRGVSLAHGWGLDGTPAHYNIGLIRYTGPGYADIPDGTHNETEIGKTVDWVVKNQDPSLPDIIDRLTGDDDHVLKQLDQLHGDLAANALYMAFKEPWRHPFNRLDAARAFNWSGPDEQGEQGGEPALHSPRGWVEASSRYQSVDYDGNAHGFTLYRHGAAFGMDTMISQRSIVGAAFRYTRPHLNQRTGEVDADDFEAGLYGLTGLPGGLDMKAYLGYSWQEYDLSRRVSLDAPPGNLAAGAWNERLSGETSGHAVGASLELTRPVPVRENLRLVPVAAIDYEKAWLDGFGETGGQAALEYGDASMERLTVRAGLKGEYTWNDQLDLKAWAQYARHISGRDYPEIDARFAAVSKPGQPAADIHGSRTDRHYINFGVGANWALDEQGDKFLYLNYDAKLNSRMTDHAGELGFMVKF